VSTASEVRPGLEGFGGGGERERLEPD